LSIGTSGTVVRAARPSVARFAPSGRTPHPPRATLGRDRRSVPEPPSPGGYPFSSEALLAEAHRAEDGAPAAYRLLADRPDKLLPRLAPDAMRPVPTEQLATAVRALHAHVLRPDERHAATRLASVLRTARLLPTLPPEATTAAYRLLLDGLEPASRVRFSEYGQYHDVREALDANLGRLAHEPSDVRERIVRRMAALGAPAPRRR